MTSKRTLHCAIAALAIAGFAGDISGASARPARKVQNLEQSRAPGTPVLAIVALAEQHVSIYDADGKILEAPVSTGATGLETPAGIYSIVQKQEEHHSNLYDDASMPFMERITWTGMALHAGVLPGYPASHGCVRMPHAFAEQLYQLTQMGMRVLVVREDMAPAPISQPPLFGPAEKTADVPSALDGAPPAIKVSNTASDAGARTRLIRQEIQLQAAAASKLEEAQAAVKREKDLRAAAAKKAAEAASFVRSLRAAESNLAKAEADMKDAERALQAASMSGQTTQAEAAKAQASTRLETARVQLQTAKTEAQAKMDAAARADEDARAAVAAMNIAKDAAEHAKQNLSPVSVFISRKTQRLYIRKGNIPVFEAPVLIRDADKPIGTFIYTALDYTGSSGDLRWNVVSMYKNALNIAPYVAPQRGGKSKAPLSGPAMSDVTSAQAAFDRLVVSPESLERISEVILPGSSLIISDEGPSNEIGKDTDFVVFMSGEPQGGIAIRQHNNTKRRNRDDDGDYWFSSSSSSSRRLRDGGSFSFFGD